MCLFDRDQDILNFKTRYGLYAPSRGGLDMLDLRHGTVVRTLIPKIAEGIFNVMCKFNEGAFARTQTVFVSCSLIPLVS